jgi:hypothetical protein
MPIFAEPKKIFALKKTFARKKKFATKTQYLPGKHKKEK